MDENILAGDIPMGFGMALAENMPAMRNFSLLTDEQQRRIIDGTHSIMSKEEMRAYVQKLAQ